MWKCFGYGHKTNKSPGKGDTIPRLPSVDMDTHTTTIPSLHHQFANKPCANKGFHTQSLLSIMHLWEHHPDGTLLSWSNLCQGPKLVGKEKMGLDVQVKPLCHIWHPQDTPHASMMLLCALWLFTNFPILWPNLQKHHSTTTIINYHPWLTIGELLKARQEHYYLPSALSWRPNKSGDIFWGVCAVKGLIWFKFPTNTGCYGLRTLGWVFYHVSHIQSIIIELAYDIPCAHWWVLNFYLKTCTWG